MTLQLIKFPNPILREKLSNFNFDDPIMNPIELEQQMLDIMYKHNGIGLSANQVGLNTRMFVMGHKDFPNQSQAFFNPIILANTDQFNDQEEGCLSFPGIYVKVKRPSSIKARWQNSKGDWQESIFDGLDCKCFLHEFDHLEGIVFQDRVSSLKWALAIKKSLKGNRNVRTR